MEAQGESAFAQNTAIPDMEMFLKVNNNAHAAPDYVTQPCSSFATDQQAGTGSSSPLLPRKDIKITFQTLVSFLCGHGGLLLFGLHWNISV